jgi:cardiolipin synthase
MREVESAPFDEGTGTGIEWWRARRAEPALPLAEVKVTPAALAIYARQYLPQGHRTSSGNRCDLLRDGVEAFPEMLRAIEGARSYIRLETYMFLDDAVGQLFARALIEAVNRGVEVTVLYDALGSWGVSAAFFDLLEASGVAVRKFRPFSFTGFRRLISRDHRKILIVDGEVAFVGGINIAAHWAPKGVGAGWRDDVLRIAGPAVRHLERRFGATWRHQHFRLRKARRAFLQNDPKVRGDIKLTVLSSRRSIHRAYLRAIHSARERVLIAAAYFVPDRKIIQALKDAAARGVEVSLVLNRLSDHPILQFATRHYYRKLLEAGIRIYEWHQGVLHAKTAVVDGVWGTIGSFNLERMSLHFNHETNVFFADPRLGGAIERSFEMDCACCHPVELASWEKRPWWQKLIERACFVFRKLL